MRCGRCGKSFDEEMYSGICPKCGHFNNRQAEYDVNRYFSARFGEQEKVSTNAQVAKQQAEPYQTGRKGPYLQGRRRQEKAAKERSIVGAAFGVMIVFSIVFTVIAVQLKKHSIMQDAIVQDDITDALPNFEQISVGAGEAFEVYGRKIIIKKAEESDISGVGGYFGEKLVAVTAEVLPADEGYVDESKEWEDRVVYVSDGFSCKENLDGETVADIFFCKENGEDNINFAEELKYIEKFMEKEYIFATDNYLYDCPKEGQRGKFYFFVNEEAENITISFEERDKKRDDLNTSVLQKRVSVPLPLEEAGR